MTGKPSTLLGDGFLSSAANFGERTALEVAGATVTYTALLEKAASLAATLSRYGAKGGAPLTAVFAYRSVTAFSGILGALLQGHGYVPLNRMFPAARTGDMLRRSGCRAMVVDAESEKQLDQILSGIEAPLLLVLPDSHDVSVLARRWPTHRFLGAKDLLGADKWSPTQVSPDSIAYLLYTSGSTGVPKGVMVAHRNVRPYIDFIAERFSIGYEDRFSQTFDPTFDLSVADMFVAWERGACVCCPSDKILINPGKFIAESRLSIWFSVPSVAVFMKRLGALKPGKYPGLRVSMFCGEALTAEGAKAWAEAAPRSVIDNLYGPTELTVACMYHRWVPGASPADSEFGLVPIGKPFPGMTALVVDESLEAVRPGEPGELVMTGPQLSLGYWNDSERTAAVFIQLPGRSGTYYRTGDRVRVPSTGGPMNYLGRVDNQIKVLGHRVELGEVEAVVREESGVDGVVALGWPPNAAGAAGIEVFLQSNAQGAAGLNERVAKRLPAYMVPRNYHYLPRFPLNPNGKFDRRALLNILQPNP